MSQYHQRVNTKDFSNERLGINFTTDNPISADCLADSFKGLSSLYRREVAQNTACGTLEDAEFVLYITRIESKCIDAELAGFAACALPLVQAMDYALIIDGFQHRFRDLMRRFEARIFTRSNTEDRVIPLAEAKDFAKIIKAAGNGGVTMERRSYGSNKEYSVEEKYEFTPAVIKAALDGVSDYITDNSLTEEADRKWVALYLNRLDRDHHSSNARSPERGTIESISSKSLPVYWVSELDSIRVKSIKEVNLFDLVFTVDVKIDSVRGKPAAYRVLKLHHWEDVDASRESPE